MTIKEIKEQLMKVTQISDPILTSFESDERVGVQRLIVQRKKQLQAMQKQELAFQNRFKLERQAWNQRKNLVAGIDEVGRGCLAGPVVTAAVILDESFHLVEVNDSKQLTAKVRERLYPQILEQAVSVGIGISSNRRIDEIGILNATKEAMNKAVSNLALTPELLLIDAVQVPTNIPKQVMFKGDALSNSIAAASIVAKEYRDHLMSDYDRVYPGYGFKHNVGYGTKDHLEGLQKLGVTEIHRQTFEPVPKFI
ncbi:ribonuclease HII [Pediococcus argentinicus]|uniref:Ribonuclease HII n=1 Tax=Pediococcus argentinicus TaxID=480391 RepID=A0A0R2NKL5_9LACO|nr:ribonuclease HII [Pediococcus argentinicus]KRO26303.1 hypothetical protein IV88_GL000088 [Pediococcus argentinicus]NKZ21505.1 ribonuclease HII [Pediococcus argentinicus]GEP18696.1 ribonuclease HII [Pediococcus argentinicus]